MENRPGPYKRDSLVVSYGIWGSSVCASGWRGGCASRTEETEKAGFRWKWALGQFQLVFLERECVRLFLMI